MNNDSLAEVMVQLVHEIRLLRACISERIKTLESTKLPTAVLPTTTVSPWKCPLCNSEMTSRTARATGEQFWGCSKYPACKGTRNSDGTPTIKTPKVFSSSPVLPIDTPKDVPF